MDMECPRKDTQTYFFDLALLVAKHNALYRARYPETDPIYQAVEKSFFGTLTTCLYRSISSLARRTPRPGSQGRITRLNPV